MDHMPPNESPSQTEAIKRKLDLDMEEWDAISFFKSGLNRTYVFNIIKFLGEIKYEVNANGLGNKFHLVSRDDGGLFNDEMILGDPLYVLLNNYIAGGMEGFLIKKCPEGTQLADNIFKHAQMTVKAIQVLVKGKVAVNV